MLCQRVNTVGGTLGERVAVADRDHLGLDLCQAPERGTVLPLIEVEAGPAGIDPRPGRHGVADHKHVALLQMEGQVPWGVPGDVDDPKRPDLVAFTQAPVDRARRVFRAPKRETDPHRIRGKGALRPQADRLCQALAGDDVGLPLVGAHQRPTEPLQPRQAAEVGAMGVGEGDVLEVAWGPADTPDAIEHRLSVGVEQRVHQGAASLRIWTGLDPPLETMRAAARKRRTSR